MLISVVVPVYNVEEYLNRCVDSILNQTFTDFELILVDDGSPDNCGKICDEYAEKDNRVRVIHKPNGGLSDARNAGIEWALKNSDSEWITFIDSDDWVHPQYLELLLKAACDSGTSISICSYVSTDKQTNDTKIFDSKFEIHNTEKFYIEKNVNAVVAWGKLYKKKDFTEIRYPVGKIHEDEFTTHKILFKYDNVAFVNEELYYYFTNPEGIMNSKWSPKRIDVLEAFEEKIDFFAKKQLINLKENDIRVYVGLIARQSNELKSVEEQKLRNQCIHILRKKSRKCLRKHRKILGFTIKNDAWLYELAYPKFMSFYWIIKSQINKIKKEK